MSKYHKTTREQKIKDILGLLSGEKKVSDLNPRLELYFDTDGETIIKRMVNGKEVDEEGFYEAAEPDPVPGTMMFIKTHGRKNDDEEIYI